MALRINFNYESAVTHTALRRNERLMNKSLLRLSTGLRILNAADDSAGLFIADQLALVSAGLEQGNRNIQTGISALQIAENSSGQIYNKLKEIYVKAQNAANDINDPNARAALQREISNLVDAIQKIGTDTEYNGIKLLDGTFTGKYIHYGPRSGQSVRINMADVRAISLGAFYLDGTGRGYSGLDAFDPTNTNIQNTDYFIDSTDYLKVAGKSIIDGATDANKLLDAYTVAQRINSDLDLQFLGIEAKAYTRSVAATFTSLFVERSRIQATGQGTSGVGRLQDLIGTNSDFIVDSGDSIDVNGVVLSSTDIGGNDKLLDAATVGNAIATNPTLVSDYNISVAGYQTSSTAASAFDTTTFIDTTSITSGANLQTITLDFYIGNVDPATASPNFSVTIYDSADPSGPWLVSNATDLANAINAVATDGVTAADDGTGKLVLTDDDGQTIAIEVKVAFDAALSAGPPADEFTIDMGQLIENGTLQTVSGDGTNSTYYVHGIEVGDFLVESDDLINITTAGTLGGITFDPVRDADLTTTVDIAFYLGDDFGSAVFTLTDLGVDTTLAELINLINAKAKETQAPIKAFEDNGRLVLEVEDGRTLSIEVTANPGGQTDAVRINLDQLIEGANQERTDATTNWKAYAVRVGTIKLYGVEAFSVEESGLDLFDGALSTLKNLYSVDVTSNPKAEEAMIIIKKAVQKVDKVRSEIGAVMNNLQAIYDAQKVAKDNTDEAESVIRNVDFAKEMSTFTTMQIRMQSGIAMLAQANTLPQLVLQLLR